MTGPFDPNRLDFQTNAPSAKSDDVLAPGVVLQKKYKILEELGRGGMGAVYKVEQIYLHDLYALKILHAHNATDVTISRFQREARAAHQLNHPNLVKVHDFGVLENDSPYLVMDYADGKSLSQFIKANDFLEPSQAIPIFVQICDGLMYAHDKGIIHRDLKPSNIILQPDGDSLRVRIVDFGIAKVMEEDAKLTRTGEAVGSPLYMSPEQCQGLPVDKRTDVYSLGCTLFEALTGLPPFTADNPFATMVAHQSEKPPTLKEACLGKQFPPALEQMMAKLLEKDPYKRYQSMQEIKQDLESIRAGKTLIETKEIMGSSKFKMKPVLIAFGAAGAVCVCLLLFWLWYALYATKTTHLKLVQETPSPDPRIIAELPDKAVFVPDKPFAPIPLKKVTNGKWVLHFPNQSLGGIWPCGEKQAEQERDTAQAKGTVVMPPRPLHLQPSLLMVQQPQFFRLFRPDELGEISFRYNMDVKDDTLLFLDHLTDLYGLNLTGTEVTDEGMKHLQELPNLAFLEVPECPGVTGKSLAKMKCIPRLLSLRISEMKGVAPLMAQMPRAVTLDELYARNTDISDADLEKVARIPRLKGLYLKKCPQVTDKSLAILTPLKNLKLLEIERTGITPKCIPTLKKFPKLEFLTISIEDWSVDDKVKLRQALQHCSINGMQPLFQVEHPSNFNTGGGTNDVNANGF
jgi:serine/threonine protein kinase